MSELALKLIREAKEKRLTRLDLRDCDLTDLPNEVSELTWLENLNLSNNINLTDISPINGLMQLKKLIIYSTDIKDLSPLIRLEKLEELIASNTLISNLSPLNGLINLNKISISNTVVRDLSHLKNLTKLKELYVYSTAINDLTPLENLKYLEVLYILNTQVSDLNPLRRLKRLQQFNANYTEINDLNPLRNLTELQQLKLSSTQVTDLSPLINLIQLNELNINHTKVSDLSPLRNMNKLQYLYIKNSKINNLLPLRNLTQLHELNICNTEISDLEPLGNLENLQGLYAGYTNLNDLTPLETLTNLQQLDFRNTQISDLTPLKRLIKLENLDFFSTKVRDLTPLKSLIQLKALDISRSLVYDLTPLNGLIKLELLFAQYINIKDLKPLEGLILLKQLYIDHTQIRDLTPLKKLIELQSFYIGRCEGIHPPQIIVDQGIKTIQRYLKELENKETILNNQTKLIFVGNSRSGKTSLWQFLTENKYEKDRNSTHGIKMKTWDSEKLGTEDNQNLDCHIWDFGGQEYYHATHRLFLSDNAVYVLVWEQGSNKQGTRLEKFKSENDLIDDTEEVELEHFPASYWLNNIRYFGKSSKILIVQNKVDEETQKANYIEYLQNIEDCFHLSVKNSFKYQEGKGNFIRFHLKLQDFKVRLLEILRQNAIKFNKVAKYWTEVRIELEILGKNKAQNKEDEYITFEQLEKIALEKDVTKTPDMQNLLIYLKSFTNTILHFPQNEVLQDRLYLNPTHISSNIYKIMNKVVRDNNGRFDIAHIENRLNCNSEDANRYVVLMQEFDLIFEKNKIINNEIKRQFTTPQYLPRKENLSDDIQFLLDNYIFENAFNIQFKNFVPRSLMLRFISNNGAKANEETYWRNGIIYKSPLTQSMIKVEYDNNLTFMIYVQNKRTQTIDMQEIIAQFIKLEDSTDNIKISNTGEIYVELNMLRRLNHENKRGDIYTNEGVTVSIKDYEWLIVKQKNKSLMLNESIKKEVQKLIRAC